MNATESPKNRTPKLTPDAIHFRWMIRSDLPRVMHLENCAFANPWREDEMLKFLASRNGIGMVAELAGVVRAYWLYELRNISYEIHNIAVEHTFRRMGLGRAIIERTKGKLSESNRKALVTYVADFNLPAQLFFKACGFRATAISRQHWEESDADAYRFFYRHRPETRPETKAAKS